MVAAPWRWVYIVAPTPFIVDVRSAIGDTTGVNAAAEKSADATDWRNWTDLYVRELKATGNPLYAEQHRARVRYLIEFLIENKHLSAPDLSAITPQMVVAWKNELAEHGQPHPQHRHRRPCGPSAQKTHIAAMKAFFDWLIQMEYIRARPNPFVGIKTAPREHQDQRALTSAEIRLLIEYAEADETGPQLEKDTDGAVRYRSSLYRVMGVVGYRINEAARLRWRDTELGRDPARINLPPRRGKARDGGVALLPETVRDALIAHRETVKPDRHDQLWPWASGNTTTVRNVLRRDCKRAGIAVVDDRDRKVGWHCFRRAVGSELARLDVNPKYAQMILRHKDIRTTLKHYTHADDTKILESGNALADRQLPEGRSGSPGKSGKRMQSDGEDTVSSGGASRNHDQTRDSAGSRRDAPHLGSRDRMAGGRATASPAKRQIGYHRFESCIAHSDTPAYLLGMAEGLRLAAEIVARSPEKGTDDERRCEACGRHQQQPESGI